jgi:hypothetical protein
MRKSTEHRTLPILITVGMLLGVGLAVASPAPSGPPTAEPPPAGFETQAASLPTPSRSPGSHVGAGDDHVASRGEGVSGGCDSILADGLTDGLGSGLPHAAFVLARDCARKSNRGLANALDHVNDNMAEGHGRGNTSDHGSDGPHGRAPHGPDPAGGPGRSGGEHGGGSGHPGGEHGGGSRGQGGGRPDHARPPSDPH